MNRNKRTSTTSKSSAGTSTTKRTFTDSKLSRSLSTLSFRPSLPTMAKVPRAPVMKRADLSLFHGKHIMFGNNVAHSERKTRRTWMPNIQKKSFFSEVLQREFRLPVTAAALRNMDKQGGFDNYLLNTRDEYLGNPGSIGNRLKKHVREVIALREAIEKTTRERKNLLAKTYKEANEKRIARNQAWEEAKPARAERMKKFYEEQVENGQQWMADYEKKKSVFEMYKDRIEAGETDIIHTFEDGSTMPVPLKVKKPRMRKLRAISRAEAILKGEEPRPRWGQKENATGHRKPEMIQIEMPPRYERLGKRLYQLKKQLELRTTFTNPRDNISPSDSAHTKRVPLQPWTLDKDVAKKYQEQRMAEAVEQYEATTADATKATTNKPATMKAIKLPKDFLAKNTTTRRPFYPKVPQKGFFVKHFKTPKPPAAAAAPKKEAAATTDTSVEAPTPEAATATN